jgi:hypothetical protein
MLLQWTWDSIVSVVTRLWAGWSRVRILAEARDISILGKVWTGTRAQPATVQWVLGAFSPTGGKVVGVWGWPYSSIYCRGEAWVKLYLRPLPPWMSLWLVQGNLYLNACSWSREVTGPKVLIWTWREQLHWSNCGNRIVQALSLECNAVSSCKYFLLDLEEQGTAISWSIRNYSPNNTV